MKKKRRRPGLTPENPLSSVSQPTPSSQRSQKSTKLWSRDYETRSISINVEENLQISGQKRVKHESSLGRKIIASLGVHSSSPTIYDDELTELCQSKVLERHDVAEEGKRNGKLTRKLLRLPSLSRARRSCSSRRSCSC